MSIEFDDVRKRDHIARGPRRAALIAACVVAGGTAPPLLGLSEGVAKEVVAMLVGSIGLIAAVPTTALTAAMALRSEPDQLEEVPAHVH